jgi:hypothetical protein
LIYSSYGQEKENSLLDEAEKARGGEEEENEATKYIKDIVNSYEEMVKNSENRNFQFSKNANREQVKSKSLINDRQERDKRIRYSVSPTTVYHNNEQQQHVPRQPVLSPTLKSKKQHNVSFSPEHHPRNIFYSTLDPGKSYFAQAIGQGQLQGQRVNLTSDRKRVRSSSSTCRTTAATNANQRISERDYKGLLNLAQKISSRDRPNQTHSADIPRSLSVNYLYNKRQGDLRRCQNKNLQVQIDFNHNGFTTEDIDDIYMPKKFELFERKLKASIDMSDNSEQEECNFRRKRFSYLKNNNNNNNRVNNVDSNKNNKRLKHDTSEMSGGGCFSEPVVNNQKILINYQKNNSKNSYLEEAKRKLSEMRSSKNAYFHNLNNKIKSSVTNVVKASQDLESRNSGLQRTRLLVNRKLSLHELYDIRKDQIRTNNANNSNNINSSFTSDDIDSVYMPWMMENYGRKLAIEALKRRNNMQDSNNTDNPHLNVHLKTNVKFKNNQKKYQGF